MIMKKIFSILLVSIVMIGLAATPVEAKKTRSASKSKSTATAKITKTYADGYPDITGHTYKAVHGKDYLSIRFGADGFAYFSGNDFKPFQTWWSYQGQGIVSAFLDGAYAVDFMIIGDGKVLEADMDGEVLEFKMIK